MRDIIHRLWSVLVGYVRWVVRQILATIRWSLRTLKLIVGVGLPLVLIWYAIGQVEDNFITWGDNDAGRGALIQGGAPVQASDPIDHPIERVEYLDQGWAPEDSLWFYQATQGSNLLPYSFYFALEQGGAARPFFTNDTLNAYRYLPRAPTQSNPDALPVGFSKDTYNGKPFLGLTCSACHTSQINIPADDKAERYLAIRIDGGPAAADMERFLIDLADSLNQTLAQDAKRQRFVESVLKAGDYDSRDDVEKDLAKYAHRITNYIQVNAPVTHKALGGEERDAYAPWGHFNCHVIQAGVTDENCVRYGYARLDAFGRIFNRVSQHLVSTEQLEAVIENSLAPDIWAKVKSDLELVWEDPGKNLLVRTRDALEQALKKHDTNPRETLEAIWARVYNPANAPVSYPVLWDIPHHDYVQWTGLVSNAGIGPLGRNVGQVIGVFATLDWEEKAAPWSLRDLPNTADYIQALLAGQPAGETFIDFESSINKRNLRRVEHQLRTLQSPGWPEHLTSDPAFTIDQDLVTQGEALFDSHCAACHAEIDPTDPDRRVIAHMSHIDSVGTDHVTAMNTISYLGGSGMADGLYVEAGPGNLLLKDIVPVASLVKLSTTNVVAKWDSDRAWIARMAEWLYDTLKTVSDNKIKPSLKQGDYDLATPRDPFGPVRSYKARSLNGIWASAPYLHNGSVPTLYQLLLPKRRGGEPLVDDNGEPIEYRPDKFVVGSREFLPDKVGFRYEGYDGFVFDTSIEGNSNAGHEYAAGGSKMPDGQFPRALGKAERLALLEYLKTL